VDDKEGIAAHPGEAADVQEFLDRVPATGPGRRIPLSNGATVGSNRKGRKASEHDHKECADRTPELTIHRISPRLCGAVSGAMLAINGTLAAVDSVMQRLFQETSK
jgi:hypothetical protein